MGFQPQTVKAFGGGGAATFFYAMQIEQRGNVHERQKTDLLSEGIVSVCACMCVLLDVSG